MPKFFLKTTRELLKKGYCRRCGRIRKHTEYHHFEYRPWAPWETVIEVCWNCHVDLDKALQKRVEENEKLQKYRRGWDPIKTPLLCYVCGKGLELQGEIPHLLADGRTVSYCGGCEKSILTGRGIYT